MIRIRFGLQSRYLLGVGVALLVGTSVVGLMFGRQAAMQREVVQLSGNVIHTMFERSVGRQGESLTRSLADALANPLYYSDLDAVGALVRNTASQEMVSYAKVYDAKGRLIHDGSFDVADYGQPSVESMVKQVSTASDVLVQQTPDVLKLAMPVMIGQQRVGSVHVGIALASFQEQEASAVRLVKQRLDALGRRHVTWLLVMLAALVGVVAVLGIYVQRTFVHPVRWLAAAAKRIEAGDCGIELRGNRRNDEIGDLLRAFGRMSESIARHDRDIRNMAHTDALTGLTNRLAFRELLDQRLQAARASGKHLALLFADIDEFKRVNDSLGHEAGDEVLVHFAERITLAVAKAGSEHALLARFGGDEFVILLGDGHVDYDAAAAAKQLGQLLVDELGHPLMVQGREIFLGTSIGIALFPGDALDASALLKNGDIAMYQAKLAGKNCYRYYSRAMDHAVERRVLLEQELRGAWERGELALVYQPVFRMKDRCPVGAEVLLRWEHPKLGTIPPSVFIDIAEHSGLIESIGPKVLHAACMDARQWPPNSNGEPLFISVNVSPRQLRNVDLAAEVAECLRVSELPAERLHVELTETALIGDEVLAASLLEKLHRAGVKVWLDDFGTGFSGLSHLRQVPVDGVKIDKSFVADVQRDPDDLALTTAIIAMGHALGITVVAEGIEQADQFTLLLERGCDLAQGYWLSRPLSAESWLTLLRS